jgi:hypothetical protein
MVDDPGGNAAAGHEDDRKSFRDDPSWERGRSAVLIGEFGPAAITRRIS